MSQKITKEEIDRMSLIDRVLSIEALAESLKIYSNQGQTPLLNAILELSSSLNMTFHGAQEW